MVESGANEIQGSRAENESKILKLSVLSLIINWTLITKTMILWSFNLFINYQLFMKYYQ